MDSRRKIGIEGMNVAHTRQLLQDTLIYIVLSNDIDHPNSAHLSNIPRETTVVTGYSVLYTGFVLPDYMGEKVLVVYRIVVR